MNTGLMKIGVWNVKGLYMKLLRPLAGYTLYNHKTNDYIRLELRITSILEKINEYRRKWLSHLQRMPQNWIPFEIIRLQTTRKENKWKTEEALARSAVTLEMERIKGSNPWCLWWWWRHSSNTTWVIYVFLLGRQSTSRFLAQHLNHCATAVPLISKYVDINIELLLFDEVGGLSPQGYSMVRWVPYQWRKRFPDYVVASCSLILKHSSTGFHTCKECHKTEFLWNHTTTDHKEGEQLEDRRNVGASSCNCGDGTDQRVQSLMFMMMMIILRKQTATFYSLVSNQVI